MNKFIAGKSIAAPIVLHAESKAYAAEFNHWRGTGDIEIFDVI